MELRTQTNGTRIVKSEYNALQNRLPFFSAIYIPLNETIIKELYIVAKDDGGYWQEYDYKREYSNTGDKNIPCCSQMYDVEAYHAGVWIYAPTGFEFSYILMEQNYVIIY